MPFYRSISKLRATLVACIVLFSAVDVLADEAVAAASEGLAVVQLEISGLATADGNVFVTAYNSADSWLGKETAGELKVDVASNRRDGVVYTAISLPPGEYALSIIYDKNNNGKLDTNFIGIPKEPVAISNNATGKFGPPKYEDARFELVPAGVVQAIEIKNID